MGPSGAGKTSLLHAISRRKVRGVHGRCTLDNVRVTAKVARRLCGYVTQEDTHVTTLSIKELLSFAAELAIGSDVSTEEKQRRVHNIIEELDLEGCCDVPIGEANDSTRAISGGERRRLSIGVELLKDPRMIFLDEPTSGLDASGALRVMLCLQKLSKRGCTVLCTIHQPSTRVLDIFDKVIVLAEGSVVYNGGTGAIMANYLSEAGYPVPQYDNVAEHILDLINTKDDMLVTSETGATASTAEVTEVGPQVSQREKQIQSLIKYYQEQHADRNGVEMPLEKLEEEDGDGEERSTDTLNLTLTLTLTLDPLNP